MASAALQVLSLEAARSSARVWGRAPRGWPLPLGVEAGQNQRARPRSRRRQDWALPTWVLLAMLPSSEVDAFEVQIEELLIAVHRVAREGLVAGPTW